MAPPSRWHIPRDHPEGRYRSTGRSAKRVNRPGSALRLSHSPAAACSSKNELAARRHSAMVSRARTVEDIMLEEPKRFWEVHRGQLREKSSMSESHNRVIWRVVDQLVPQLDR